MQTYSLWEEKKETEDFNILMIPATPAYLSTSGLLPYLTVHLQDSSYE